MAHTQEEPQNVSDASSREKSRVELFTTRLFARLPADLSETFTASRQASIAESAFDFFAIRSESPKVRTLAGDDEGITIVETAMPDCPFIVDSVLEYFRKRQLVVRLVLHPLFNVARDSNGALVSFEQAAAAEKPESLVHAEVELAPEPAELSTITADLTRVLIEVQQATADFALMTARAMQICEETAALRELVEIRDFLRWLVQGGFVFLGYRRYQVMARDGRRAIIAEPGSSLGIMRSESRSRYAAPVALDDLEEAHRKLLFESSALIVGKTGIESEVHRRAAMDDITIRRTDANGKPIGFDRFIGLFTTRAYSEEAQHIPVLRAKLAEVVAAEGAQEGSHDYKALVAAFNSFPKEELFRARVAELRSQLRLVLDVKSEADVRLIIESDAVRGNVVAIVIMPRDRFSADVRMRIQDALAAMLGGKVIYYYLALGETYTARLHFCFAAAAPRPEVIREMEAAVAKLARNWSDLLREALVERFGQSRGEALAPRWVSALGQHYKSSTSVELAVGDIAELERLIRDGRFSVLIGPASSEAPRDASELRLYELGEAPILSELFPILQNFGISVISEEAYELSPVIDGRARPAYVQAFRVRSLDGKPLENLPGAALLADALVAVRTELAEDDSLNALTLSAGLSWQEVALVRSYLAAAFQMQLAPSHGALRRLMVSYPRLARALVEFFKLRLDPRADATAEKLGELRASYFEQLGAVENIADDRMARALLAMIEATVRTSYFRLKPAPVPYLALKFESGKIPNLPDTAPLYEIHVNSPQMAGCHLRAGRIARGGIRYSDRPDDYRTEILDLMKTQTVKNAIIVPVGSKGGFIVKQRGGRLADRQAVIGAYTTLINSMLDLTDNLVDGQIVHPEDVKVLDNDGPYLVVAADKGTASFSDIANAIAESRGFWLADAFASGGEHGYDHKKLGITARGAWESAKRHLREMGRDIRRGAPIITVGIGDMSGDVFGNGLLQSDNVKLIAAFDHRHIFIDPNPDPAVSYAERKRLYETPNSQWADYNPALISQGGGVFGRGQKRIELSPEARAALKCASRVLDANSLVQTILRADADILYNGGIGTYVRASDETDADVGDHANDPCRVAASELHCKVVVEGGNLGFTQKARIEYALGGGRINTDAIDNSAGVDMSDHEVNLKILLQPAVARGALTSGERNRRLAAAGNEVAESVLRDNRDQALSLSLEQIRSRTEVSAFRDHVTAIEQRGIIRRVGAVIPTLEELRERRSIYAGLARPELALVTALTKIDLTSRLEATSLVDDSYLAERFLRPYFPGEIARTFASDVLNHSLRRELVATSIVNELVDLMGSVFIFNLIRDHAVEAEDAARAYLVTEGILDLRERTESLKAAVDLSAESELGAFLGLERAARHACTWAIGDADTKGAIGKIVDRFKPAFDQLAQEFEPLLRGGERDRFERVYRELRTAVHHEQLAHELARLAFADHLLNILSLSFGREIAPKQVADFYFGISEWIDFAILEGAIDALSSDDRWERRAARDLGAELAWSRSQLCASLLEGAADGTSGLAERISRGRERRANEVERLMSDLRTLPAIGLPPLQVTVRTIARLAAKA